MKKAKTIMLAIAIVAVAGGTKAFTAKGYTLTYFGCGMDLRCDNPKTIRNARVSTLSTDSVRNGSLTSSTIFCVVDADCGRFYYTFLL